MFGFNYTGQQDEEAKRIAKAATDDPVMQKYLEGLTHRILVLEEKVKDTRFNFWALVFILFILPLFFGGKA